MNKMHFKQDISTHSNVLFFLSGSLICIIIIIVAFIYPYYGNELHLCLCHYWSFFCFMFMISWWLLYFMSPNLNILSLRLFLMEHSLLRSDMRDNKKNDIEKIEKAVKDKSTSSILVLTIYIAILAIFITAIMGKDPIYDYQLLLRKVILVIAVITIISMILAIDLLDSVANLFSGGVKEDYEYKLIFYKKCGPQLPKGGAGGIGYSYFGYACFSLFLILSVSFFNPLLSGLGLSVFTYLGYPIMFGYKRVILENDKISVEFDEGNKVKIISIILGGTFLLITILIYIMGFFGF